MSNPKPKPISLSAQDVARFWAKVDKTPGQGPQGKCWEWKNCRTKEGYGRLQVRHTYTYIASRIAYFCHYGVDPKDMKVCHTCDNPPCCNPTHFFLGTTQDNATDASRKGRLPKGSRHVANTHPEKHIHGSRSPAAKIKEDDVRDIRQAFSDGVSAKVLAVRYGLFWSTIYKIVNREKWKLVD